MPDARDHWSCEIGRRVPSVTFSINRHVDRKLCPATQWLLLPCLITISLSHYIVQLSSFITRIGTLFEMTFVM